MKLEDKKKIIAWMGLIWIDRLHIQDKNGDWVTDGSAFNPDTDRNVWPEIFDKIKEKGLHDEYLEKVDDLMSIKYPAEWITDGQWLLHTAPPEICTKALVEVIK